ncbi:hypothetical protein [Azospira restricta]|uniref:Transmembrane protein n=1 Tax=Azospira restricta TaxID=404405 RepID=A0A974SM42_9RHOO|nr:hypothetical protein [Azospira restricta]QRJ62726.1 hypothetical protein IWH25_13230 [Azospira restricta]
MRRRAAMLTQRLLAHFVVAIVFYGHWLTGYLNVDTHLHGIPVFYVALFLYWLGYIALIWLINRCNLPPS